MATKWKDPVKVATSEALGSPPGIPGDGKIDGVTVAAGDRVLVKDQDDPRENGIYLVQAGLPLALARPAGEIIEAGDAVLVLERHTSSERWALGAGDDVPITVGTTLLPWGRREPFFNVLDFGADPTGNDNSWQAFKDWSTAISKAGGGMGLVPSGTYKIDKVAVAGPGGWTGIGPEDFKFEGCEGLWLVGYGAKLNLAAEDVHVALLPDGSPDKHMVCPFFIQDCTNVCLEGFEINGNVDKLTQDAGVSEPGGHCVTISNSRHVTIRQMRIHHGWTDGISVRAAFEGTRLACRNITIENCEVYAHVRACIAVHETRHIRISDCRIYDSGMGIDIEPDLRIGTEFDKDIRPPGSSRFTIIENCEIYNNEKPLSVGMRYSQVRVQGCFIDNQHNDQQPVILDVPHCALLDSEINTGTGRIDVALTGANPGRNVFTMERCLIRSNTAMVKGALTTGAGLFIALDPTDRPTLLKQALIANNRFINQSEVPWFPIDAVTGKREDNGARFPNLSHGSAVLQLTFRDNYVFIPKEAFHGRGEGMVAVGITAHLAENNVYETDLASALPLSPPSPWEASSEVKKIAYEPGDVVIESDVHYLCRVDHTPTNFSTDLAAGYWAPVEYIEGASFQTFYRSGTPPRFGVLVRNERFLSAGDGTAFRPADNSKHDNTLPFSQGVSAVGTDLALIGSGGGQLTVDLEGGSLTLNSGDLAYAMVKTVGNLPGDRTLTFPAPNGDIDSFQRTVRNQCTGFAVIVRTGVGTEVTLGPGESASLIFDSSGVGSTVT